MSPRPGLSRERVIDAAVDVANERGLQALTLARVAELLGVRTPSLYNHVAGLDDVRQALTVRAVNVLGQRLQRAAVGRAGADALHAMADAYRRFVLQHPGLAGATVPTTEVDGPEVRRAGAEVLETLLAALSSYQLGERERIHAARAFRSAVHGFVVIEAAGGFGLPEDVDESFRWMVDLLAAALDTAGTSAP
jgi:AcrR family transcriptional regulator